MGFGLQRTQSLAVALGYKRMQVDDSGNGGLCMCSRSQSSSARAEEEQRK